MEAQREVAGLARDLLARKWLRARPVSNTALQSGHPAGSGISLSGTWTHRLLELRGFLGRFSPVPRWAGVGDHLQMGPVFEVTLCGQAQAWPLNGLNNSGDTSVDFLKNRMNRAALSFSFCGSPSPHQENRHTAAQVCLREGPALPCTE